MIDVKAHYKKMQAKERIEMDADETIYIDCCQPTPDYLDEAKNELVDLKHKIKMACFRMKREARKMKKDVK